MQRNQEGIRRLISQKFLERKCTNPGYSLRSYARQLKISSGALSAVMNGKRNISQKISTRLANELGLSPSEKAALLLSPNGAITKNNNLKIEEDQFRTIVEWYHFAILSLVKTKGFKNDPKWIAHRFGIKETEAQAALERLINIGLLIKKENGTLKLNRSRVETTENIKSPALRLAHANNLRLAQRSLDEDNLSRRDFSAITITFSPEKLPKLQAEIREFQDRIQDLFETPFSTDVYKICVQVFPLTREA